MWEVSVLFQKAPKTETELGLATHHQRAHIRNCKLDMFKEENGGRSLMISFDDKAYIRPGSDVGARNAKKGEYMMFPTLQNKKRFPNMILQRQKYIKHHLLLGL